MDRKGRLPRRIVCEFGTGTFAGKRLGTGRWVIGVGMGVVEGRARRDICVCCGTPFRDVVGWRVDSGGLRVQIRPCLDGLLFLLSERKVAC